ncbi:MAG: RING finger protein, partial [bacterium]
KSVNKFFESEKINYYEAQAKEDYEIDQAKKYVIEKLKRKMRKEKRDYVRKEDVKKATQKEFRNIADKIKRKNYSGWNLLGDIISGIFSEDNKENYDYDRILNWDWSRDTNKKIYRSSLERKIKEIVNKQLKKNGMNHNEIPNKLMPEYYEKIQYITDRMKILMNSWNHENFVYEYEINNATKDELEPFIRNMSTVVLSKDLDRTIKKVITKELKLNGINEIPYNAKSTYNEDQKVIKNELNKIMNKDGRNYVRINEIEKVVKEELKPTINKINFGSSYYTPPTNPYYVPPVNPYYVEPGYPYIEEEIQPNFAGEICTICQDNYLKNERISKLSCGHCFHEECINTWFATKESQVQKRSCPICRAQNNLITSKIYTNK